MTEWRPIETSPKDGTLVRIRFHRPLVIESDGHQDWETVACYRADDPPPLTPSAWQLPNGQGFAWAPTHWRPIEP